jgi:hypothetical protein
LNGNDDGQIIIPASFFNVGAVDNCSSTEEIVFSFSENIEDTEKVVECGDTGFQFFRIYYTDKAGNQDFCEVFMLIFDNGTCFGKYAPEGKVSKPNGTPIEGAIAYLMEGEDIISLIVSDETGSFTFGEQNLMESYNAVVKKESSDMEDIDIEDFVLMRQALLGLGDINYYQKVAADVNQDFAFDIDDLYEFREILLGRTQIANEKAWKFVPEMHKISDSQTNLNVSNTIPYTSYEAGFNYYGVKTGDLTGAAYDIDNLVLFEDDVELTLKITNNIIAIIANEDFMTDAYQITLEQSDVQNMSISEKASLMETNAGIRYTNLNASNSISQSQELIKAHLKLDKLSQYEQITSSTKILLSGSLKPANIKWTIIDERENVEAVLGDLELNVFPLPMENTLTIEASNNITSVSLYTVTGSRVEINVQINNDVAEIRSVNSMPNGIYFLKVISKDVEKTVKIVK